MTRTARMLLGLALTSLAVLALGAACGDDDDPDPEEYYTAIEDNEDEIDNGAFADDGFVFNAEDAKSGAEAAVEAVEQYVSTLDDLDVPDEAQDAHDKLKGGVEDFRDRAQEVADSTEEGAPTEELFESLFSTNTSDIDEALCELQELAAAEDITIDVCGGEDEDGEEAVDPSTLPAEPATAVEIIDFAFQPPHIEVAVGDTVTWTQSDSDAPHTATADEGAFDSGTLEEGDTFEFTFAEAGEFSYFCTIHPEMLGLVTVVE